MSECCIYGIIKMRVDICRMLYIYYC